MHRSKALALGLIAVVLAIAIMSYQSQSRGPRPVDLGHTVSKSLPMTQTRSNTSELTLQEITLSQFSVFRYSFGDAAAFYWELQISASGEAIYTVVDRTNSPNILGRARFTVTEVELSDLLTTLRREKLHQLPDRYDTGWADVDVVGITLNCQAATKRVAAVQHFPQQIVRISQYIDAKILRPYNAEIANAKPFTEEEAAESGW